LCGEPIRSTEVEFEVPEPEDGSRHDDYRHAATRHAAPGTAFRFHITCYAVWQLECAEDETAA
jgi:hypothetical protein